MHILNYYIPIGKRNIFLQRNEFKPPIFDHFLKFAKDKLSGSPPKSGPLDFGTKNNFPSFFVREKGLAQDRKSVV